MESGRISEHGFLADGRSAALVDRAGSVNRWCPPGFDAPSVFGRLLDDRAGHWSIQPDQEFTSERAYLDDTLVLRTVFQTRGGAVAVTDALALEPGARRHDVGLRSPRAMARVVEGLSGEVPMRLHLRPRFEDGLVTPYFVERQGCLEATAGSDRLMMRSSVPLEYGEGDATAVFTVRAGSTEEFLLGYVPTYDGGPPGVGAPHDAVVNAVQGWRSWAGLHNYAGRYREQVRRSAMVVHAMSFGSVRDFSHTLQALLRATCPQEATRHFVGAVGAMGRTGDELASIMCGVEGERDGWRQRQTDVLSAALDAAWLMRDHVDPMSPEVRQPLREFADKATQAWRRPDRGMWETRDGERHYVSSKVQCWTALDRAVRFGERLGDASDVARWTAARDQVRGEVLSSGWSDRVGAYTGAFESDSLDAAVLIMPLVGFLPATDPRMRATIDLIEHRLSQNGQLRRWDRDPAGSVICSFWLVSCLALAGELDRADQLFEQLVARTNDLGLFAEQIDPMTGEQLGNFPHAFSHVGLINAAGHLAEAHDRQRDRRPLVRSPRPVGSTTFQ